MPPLLLASAGPTGSGSFSPASVAGLELWLKADSLALSDGTAVATWSDSSGNGKDATQATGANQPLFKTAILNGLPVLRFDGVNDDLVAAGLTGNDATRTLFVVCKRSAVVALQGAVGFSSSNAVIGDSNGGQWLYQTNQAGAGQALGADSANFAILCVRFNSAASADGFVDTSAAVNFDPNDTYSTGGGALRVGSVNGSFYWTGDIAEVLSYNSALSEADRTSVRDYLRTKYGL